MSWFDWLFKKSTYRRFDDSYALSRNKLWPALNEAIQSQLNDSTTILLVCHFAETFTEIQDQLDQAEMDYSVVTYPLNAENVTADLVDVNTPIRITLADLLEPSLAPTEASTSESKAKSLAIMVCEMHPLMAKDEAVEAFAKKLGLPVQLGYFLALDDAVVQLAINETTISLLRQMGLEDHDLISSQMVTRRVRKVLKRLDGQLKSYEPADSAEEWLQLNAAE